MPRYWGNQVTTHCSCLLACACPAAFGAASHTAQLHACCTTQQGHQRRLLHFLLHPLLLLPTVPPCG